MIRRAAMLLVVASLTPSATAQTPSDSLAPVIAQVLPGVALLRIYRPPPERPGYGPPFDQFFSRDGDEPEEREESATAFVVDAAAGLLVTSDYVVRDPGRIEVVLANGEVRAATLAGVDEATGIGLVRTAPGGLTAATWSDTAPAIGDAAILVAYVFRKGPVATTGIVAGRDHLENFASLPSMFLDVAINKGAAGGIVTDRQGRVIGMAYGMYGASTDPYMSLGVAVPATEMRPVIEALARDGRIRRGAIGVTITPVRFGGGVEVVSVVEGSAADRAGVKARERIVALNGESLRDDLPLRRHIARAPVGTTLVLSVKGTNGETREVSLATEERPD